MHQTLLADHPGSVDPENPAFRQQLDSAYPFALERARKVDDFGGYLYALRSFTTPFHDEHLKVGLYKLGDRTYRWPGFTVGLRGDAFVVIRREDDAAPPMGARLISAGEKSPEDLIAERVEPYIGNWTLRSKRAGLVPYLFINTGNPFIADLASAIFEVDGARAEYQLTWRKIEREVASELFRQEEPTVKTESVVRLLDDGTVWISVADFNVTNPERKAAFDALVMDIRARQQSIASSPAMVVDVRGNGGGSKLAAVELAKALWGDGYVESIRPRVERVDWRASKGNLAALQQFLPAIRTAYGDGSETYQSMARVSSAMVAAVAAGEPYASDVSTFPAITDSSRGPVPARTYLLTDGTCVSACLDFVDVARRVSGVVHIGQETAGDTSYLDVRNEKLPSGLGELIFSASAHRGRMRADNATYVPTHAWDGDISDTQALEVWVGTGFATP
jgi:hypothetical protein